MQEWWKVPLALWTFPLRTTSIGFPFCISLFGAFDPSCALLMFLLGKATMQRVTHIESSANKGNSGNMNDDRSPDRNDRSAYRADRLPLAHGGAKGRDDRVQQRDDRRKEALPKAATLGRASLLYA